MKENKLIAEFMGFKQPHPEYPNTSYWYKELPNGRLETLAILNYHISWDWLIPVVQKIEQVNDGVPSELWDVSLYSYQEEIYDAVVEFIKEYNKES